MMGCQVGFAYHLLSAKFTLVKYHWLPRLQKLTKTLVLKVHTQHLVNYNILLVPFSYSILEVLAVCFLNDMWTVTSYENKLQSVDRTSSMFFKFKTE